ncbi:N-ethylmaleimide reductase [Nitrosomonas cryotolerans]|uniref:N-ethylmaleimide reductase n=1 Tax=Nitrosomonas cryotolerans ATCC 49181 TaxID=1131553 RepID=A0A1N6I099_9PROT|nr:alkene reductase [Nitrosomonas cryotolerans]SFQ09182.1 N-ethylmaleimide reductase [Nitrosomonas cryotolerans]SIO25462.1 N-ethylmaleimide reductase [Nitrosomonas cryotolerans ATCC 49181]
MNTVATILSAIQVGPYTLENRVIMAPLTRSRAGQGNMPTALNVHYYTQRASAGLIITEATQVSLEGVGYPLTPGIHNAEQVAGWRRVTDSVHAKGGRIFLQLWHVGRISHPSLQPNGALPLAPSEIRPGGQAFTYAGLKDFVTPRALKLAEIPTIVEQFRKSAANALTAGFDGVEIHGANGYLLDQFLRDGTNQRLDAYGGSIKNRVRLVLEVTEAVCSVWGANRVGIRLSPLTAFNDMRDSCPEETFSFAVRELNRFGLAYLHITEMGKDKPGAAGPTFDLIKLRHIWKGPYMTNGGYDLESANAVLAQGAADMVAFGTLFIANPDLPLRFAEHAPLNVPDPETFYGGDEKGYTDYPYLDD